MFCRAVQQLIAASPHSNPLLGPIVREGGVRFSNPTTGVTASEPAIFGGFCICPADSDVLASATLGAKIQHLPHNALRLASMVHRGWSVSDVIVHFFAFVSLFLRASSLIMPFQKILYSSVCVRQ